MRQENERQTETRGERFKSPVSLIRYFLRGSLGIFLISMAAAALVSFLDMILPRMITFTVDSIIGDAAPDLPAFLLMRLDALGGTAVLKERPYLIAAAVAAVAAVSAVFRFLFRFLNEAGAERFVKRMRDELYRHIEHLPYAWHGRNSTGDIIQRCTSDVETIKVFVSEQLTSLIRVLVLIVLALFFMAGINGTMTLISSFFIPVVISYSLFFYSKIGDAFERADAEEGKLSAIAQENLTGVRVVRAFGREQYERERFGGQNDVYTHFWVRLIRILSLNWITGDLMTGSQYLLVTVLGAFFCVRGQITAGQYIAFVSYNSMLTWPVRSLGRVISEMSKAGISLNRLRYIMNAEEEKDPEGALTPPVDRDIVFDHVSFSYEDASGEALHDISFTIPAGTTCGILGGTGSGKSTLMYLLEKLYEPDEGTISIGGVPLSSVSGSYLRSNIGMVQQEPYLFSRSLAENIGIALPEEDDASPEEESEPRDRLTSSGRRSFFGTLSFRRKKESAREGAADLEAVRSASATADLLETAERFPSGFDTFVGERGVTLSGGQKQRAAIAQMLIRKCPVMIFDDSLSAVDAATDARIRSALKQDTKGATVILIAHRITTLMHADLILVMDKGRIAEQGTHEELMARDGLYAKICRLQLKGADESGKEGGQNG